MNLADRIQSLRKAKGISQEQLADAIGVSRQAVSKWESEQAVPDLVKLILLCDYFDVSSDYLIRGIEPTEEESKFKFFNKIKDGIVLGIGLTGLLVLFILSRIYTVPIPYYYIQNGVKNIYWGGDRVGHSFVYFLEIYQIQYLAVCAWFLVIGGLIQLLYSKKCFEKKKCILSVIAVLLVVVLAFFSMRAPKDYEKHVVPPVAVETSLDS